MKRKLLFTITIFCLASIQSFSQSGCLIDRDSSITLDSTNFTTTTHYFHDAAWPYNLELIDNDSTTAYDSIYYNGSNQIIKTTTYAWALDQCYLVWW